LRQQARRIQLIITSPLIRVLCGDNNVLFFIN